MAASTSAESPTVRTRSADDLLKRDTRRNNHKPIDPASAAMARIDVKIWTCSAVIGDTVRAHAKASRGPGGAQGIAENANVRRFDWGRQSWV